MMIDNLLIFQATIGVKDKSFEFQNEYLQRIKKELQNILEQENYTIKIITVCDNSKELGVDVKLIYPIYNLIDKDSYDKHIELHHEIDKIKKELEDKVD